MSPQNPVHSCLSTWIFQLLWWTMEHLVSGEVLRGSPIWCCFSALHGAHLETSLSMSLYFVGQYMTSRVRYLVDWMLDDLDEAVLSIVSRENVRLHNWPCRIKPPSTVASLWECCPWGVCRQHLAVCFVKLFNPSGWQHPFQSVIFNVFRTVCGGEMCKWKFICNCRICGLCSLSVHSSCCSVQHHSVS